MSNTPSDRRITTATTAPRQVLTTRLTDAELNPCRCAPVEEGTKRSYDHYNRSVPTDRAGNYAVFGGDGLVILDVDVGREKQPDWLRDLPPTFEVASPHGGRHLYFAVADESGISNTSADSEWGSIRTTEWYVLGPGSIIDHGTECDPEKAGCPGTGVGKYQIEADRPIATLVGEDLIRLQEISGKDGESKDSATAMSGGRSISNSNSGLPDLDQSIRRRLRRAEKFVWGDQFTALKEGRYADAGFPNDRSRAEFRLVEILGWLFDDNEEIVRQVMTAICRQIPETSEGHRRKWIERDDGYRKSTIQAACRHDSTYEPPSTRPPGFQPEVSHVTSSKVFEAILDLGIASTTEITQYDIVDRSQRQVQRALKEYLEEDLIQSVRDGREVLYYFREEFVPPDQRESYSL